MVVRPEHLNAYEFVVISALQAQRKSATSSSVRPAGSR
jgi:hypothetical protein